MPGVKEAELKARWRRSAALLTGRPGSDKRTDSRIPGSPNRDPAVADTQSEPKEEFEYENDVKDVVIAERTDDSCCTEIAQYWSGLIGSRATVRVSWSGSAEITAQLDSKSS